ncbi:MAG: hypothetical protein NTU88_09885, partial [Armatimonadetes bacterium]|nr:hypothetical protein [Armatimonadota bacterium]
SRSNVLGTNDRAIGMRTTPDGVDHVLISSGTEVYDIRATIAEDGLSATWQNRVWLYTAGADDAYGMCANSDMTVIYQASRGGAKVGVRKYVLSGTTWTMDPDWKAKFFPLTNVLPSFNAYDAWEPLTEYVLGNFRRPITPNGHRYRILPASDEVPLGGAGTSGATEPVWPTGNGATVVDGTATWIEMGTMGDLRCTDVEIAADGDLWVTVHRGDLWYTSSTMLEPTIYKISAFDGAYITSYPVALHGFMLARDAVGNIAMTFGKDTPTWPGKFWGMFAVPGTYAATKTTNAFYVPLDPAPVLVPGSEQWTYASGAGLLTPNAVYPTYPAWQALTEYAFGNYVKGTTPNGHRYRCITAGTSAATEPIWPTGTAETVDDDTVTWMEDGTTGDTATVSFQVIDANGFADIGAIDLDLKELKTTDDPSPVLQPDTKVVNGSNGMIADCTKTVTAVCGTQTGVREIGVKPYDTHGTITLGSMHVSVAGNFLDTWVKHTRTGFALIGATLYARGGKVGAYGYPFTYESPYASAPGALPGDPSGNVVLDVSEGTYEVWAEMSGYKTQALLTVNVPVVTIPAQDILVENAEGYMGLGPLTIAEARDFGRGTTYASVEGLVYARPKGIAPTKCDGLDDRLDTAISTTLYFNRRMWYMCDPDDPDGAANGLEFQLRIPDVQFTREWDDSAKKDGISGNSLYLGKRPDVGDTICVSGWLETRPGYETRLLLDDEALRLVNAGDYSKIYLNLTPGTVPVKPLPTVLPKTVSQISHADNASYEAMWGQYATVENAIPILWMSDGMALDGTGPADLNKYVVIKDLAGNWSSVTFQSLTSLSIPPGSVNMPPPVTLGATYTFTGACGRRSRFGIGTIRPRGPGDIVMTSPAPPPPEDPDNVGVIRGISSGSVSFHGIVTAKFTGYMFVESSDRSVGVKVLFHTQWAPAVTWTVGDEVQVTGTVALVNGMKQVTPTTWVLQLATGQPLPELGMRHRDVGGVDCYNTWTATTGYKVGNLVVPTIWNGSRYACTVAGTSGETEPGRIPPGDPEPPPLPPWPAELNGTVVDGTVTWTNVGWDYIANPATDPGVYHGRGPLNVGLLVTVSGLVTYRDDATPATFFYIWDGSNMCVPGIIPQPLDDGTGYRGLRIDHSGLLPAPSSRGVKAYQDWVTVNGIVGVQKLVVGAETISIPAVLPKTVTLNSAYTAYTVWAASTAYALNSIRVPTVANGHWYACTVAGTSGETEPGQIPPDGTEEDRLPPWPSELNATVVDGTATWTESGT